MSEETQGQPEEVTQVQLLHELADLKEARELRFAVATEKTNLAAQCECQAEQASIEVRTLDQKIAEHWAQIELPTPQQRAGDIYKGG